MTKKDFQLIADAMYRAKPEPSTDAAPKSIQEYAGQVATWSTAIFCLADELQQQNPRFNRELFINACRS